jgi:flagellin
MITSLARELDQAEANANDAIGLIQTEEGALTETHSMLQRMTTLATQAANGTYSTSDEGKTARDSIQKEVDELANEITRIAQNTKYNGLHPLDGNNQASAGTYGTVTETTPGTPNAIVAAANSVDGTGIMTDGKGSSYVTKTSDGKTTVVGTFTETDAKAALQDQTAKLNDSVKAANAAQGATTKVTYKAMTAAEITTANLSITAGGAGGNSATTGNAYIVEDTETLNGNTHAYKLVAAKNTSALATDAKTSLDAAGEAIQLQVGPTAGETLTVDQTDMTFAGLFGANNKGNNGTAATAVSAEANENGGAKVLDMSSVKSANDAITRIQTAINTVSSYRADLGAKQNRLEHTINNLKTTNENVTAAESRIRDTDMAKEIAAYTKNNILSQAAQSMLAQANQSGQGVLTLLRG